MRGLSLAAWKGCFAWLARFSAHVNGGIGDPNLKPNRIWFARRPKSQRRYRVSTESRMTAAFLKVDFTATPAFALRSDFRHKPRFQQVHL